MNQLIFFIVYISCNSFIFLGKYKRLYRLSYLYDFGPWILATYEESLSWISQKSVNIILVLQEMKKKSLKEQKFES